MGVRLCLTWERSGHPTRGADREPPGLVPRMGDLLEELPHGSLRHWRGGQGGMWGTPGDAAGTGVATDLTTYLRWGTGYEKRLLVAMKDHSATHCPPTGKRDLFSEEWATRISQLTPLLGPTPHNPHPPPLAPRPNHRKSLCKKMIG